MARKSKKKAAEKGKEFYENPEILAQQISKTEEFIAANKIWALWISGLIVVAITAFFVYQYYINNQNELAQADMFQAVFYFEHDSLDLALNGDGNNYGFKDIMNEYPGTDAANLANYYTGVIHLKKENYKVAILYFEDFKSSDLLIQARAYSLTGDAYMEEGDNENAVNYYEKAADYHQNKYFSPVYLMKAAIAWEKLEELEKAKGCYEEIVKDYKGSTEYQAALKEKARLEAMLAS